VLLSPALGAVLMSASTVIVAVNARLLRLKKEPSSKALPRNLDSVISILAAVGTAEKSRARGRKNKGDQQGTGAPVPGSRFPAEDQSGG